MCFSFKLKFILAVLLVVIIAPYSAQAGWVDDWVASTSKTPASTFKGSERTYYDLGSTSLRWNSSTTYPITASPFRIKSGCGGIDIFRGGMSFMDADKLVEKLEEILENSPTVALDLALNVLCESCANSMKWIEDKVNALNSIQLDSCKASKALVYSLFQDPDAKQQELHDPMGDYYQSSGLSTLFDDYDKGVKSQGGLVDKNYVADAISQCSADLKAVFATADANTYTTLLENVGMKIGVQQPYISIIRGIIGDVGIFPASQMYNSWIMEGCIENKSIISEGSTNQFYAKDISGVCTQSVDSKNDLESYASTILSSMVQKMLNKQALNDEERTFSLNYMDGFHWTVLRTGVMAHPNDPESQIAMLAPLIAKHITVKMIGDVISLTRQMIAHAKEVEKKEATTTDSTSQSKCQTKFFAGTMEDMDKFMKQASDYYAIVNNKYIDALKEVANKSVAVAHFETQEELLRNRLGKMFGRVVSSNLLSK